ncbi:MAG: acetate/propionate family kinase [Candidatus Eisenbacteria bacterium]|nr:acetate/propionate family kinase [Candidatus Eisenbacteria bacterium]
MRILTVNAGSSSLKLRVLESDERVSLAADLPAESGRVPAAAIAQALGAARGIGAVGHRVVHGGTAFTRAVRIEGDVERRLAALTDLAPLHQPISLAMLAAVRAALPGVPEVACFDTAFHADLPPEAATYALPREWLERWAVRRYCFHGLSHAYASRRAAQMLGRTPAVLRVVVAHLGAGASLAAVANGRSHDTTMGFTPLEGLVMATRSGSVDPGLVLWLETHAGLSPAELTDALEHRSGLLALAGVADMREVTARAARGDEAAGAALDVYVHRLAASVAAMAAAVRGLDALVFTGGVGEGSAVVRARTAERLGFLGLALDEARNQAGGEDRDVSADAASVRTLVIAAREDLEIARQTREALAG